MVTGMLGVLVLLVLRQFQSSAAVCHFNDGQYELRWGLDTQRNVHFRLTYFGYPLGAGAWTGVAFGTSMRSGLDVIMVRVIDNRVIVSDEFVRGFRSPLPDFVSNIQLYSTSLNNGNLDVRFSRALYTGDIYDQPISSCLTWQFPTRLSPLGLHGTIHKHQVTPIAKVICMDQCRCNPQSAISGCDV